METLRTKEDIIETLNIHVEKYDIQGGELNYFLVGYLSWSANSPTS